ncbi:Uncharacterised protein [Mycobacterium tuberculosis]|nr:Uncharacterised protein [Mycobacterium tuberculosis]
MAAVQVEVENLREIQEIQAEIQGNQVEIRANRGIQVETCMT